MGRLHSVSALSVILFVAVGFVHTATADWTTEVSGGVGARIYASTIHFQNSVYMLGGCTDPSCALMTSAVSRLTKKGEKDNATSGSADLTELKDLKELPLGVLGPDLGWNPITFAGQHSAVTTHAIDLASGLELEMVATPWVVGACSLHFQSTLSEVDAIKFNTIWQLGTANGTSGDLSKKSEYNIQLGKKGASSIPTRVNASCAAYGTTIYILGGVYMDRTQGSYLELIGTVDVFDTKTSQYTHGAWQHKGGAIMNPVLCWDNVMLYVAGGLVLSGEGSDSGNGPNLPETKPSDSVYGYTWPAHSVFRNVSAPLTPNVLPKLDAPVEKLIPFSGSLMAVETGATRYSVLRLTDPKDKLTPAEFLSWTAHVLESSHSLGTATLVGVPTAATGKGLGLKIYRVSGVNASNKVVGGVSSCTVPGFELPAPTAPLPQSIKVNHNFSVTFAVSNPDLNDGSYLTRLSLDSYCVGDAASTHPQYAVPLKAQNATLLIEPTAASPKNYLCVGNSSATWTFLDKTFFAPLDPFAPIAVLPKVQPTTNSPTKPGEVSSSGSTTASPDNSERDLNPGKKSGVGTAAAVVGTILGLCLLFGLAVWVCRCRADRKEVGETTLLNSDQPSPQPENQTRESKSQENGVSQI